MLARTLFTTAFLTLAVALNAYAPNRDAGAGNRDRDERDGTRDKAGTTRDEGGAMRDRQRDFANAKVTADVTLFHAPNQAIGMLRAGARVRVDRLDGAWAHVVFISNQIAVQGWVDRRALAALTKGDGDRANTQKDRERERIRKEQRIREEKARKQERLREEARDR